MKFDEYSPGRGENTVIFMLYDYIPDANQAGAYRLTFDRAVGTRHSSLMTASLYQQVPSKDAFCSRILAKLES